MMMLAIVYPSNYMKCDSAKASTVRYLTQRLLSEVHDILKGFVLHEIISYFKVGPQGHAPFKERESCAEVHVEGSYRIVV